MSVGFGFQLAVPEPDGSLRLVEADDARFSDRLKRLRGLLESMSAGRKRPPVAFPWLLTAYDWDSGRKPRPADCAKPRDVLQAVQGIERELQRNSTRYPADWMFCLRGPDGQEQKHRTLNAIYRGTSCRLFGDAEGCWAVDLTPGPAHPVHFALSDLSSVVVRLSPDDLQEVAVRVERTDPFSVHASVLGELKALCLRAEQQRALLLPWLRVTPLAVVASMPATAANDALHLTAGDGKLDAGRR